MPAAVKVGTSEAYGALASTCTELSLLLCNGPSQAVQLCCSWVLRSRCSALVNCTALVMMVHGSNPWLLLHLTLFAVVHFCRGLISGSYSSIFLCRAVCLA